MKEEDIKIYNKYNNMKNMKTVFQKRTLSFLWRAGAFVALSILAYLANISDIREIDSEKLLTIFVTTVSAYIINEITKFLNSKK